MATIIDPLYLARSGTEHGEQTALFCWVSMAMRNGFEAADSMLSYAPEDQKAMRDASGGKLAIPELEWLYAIPNGGWRGMSQGGALKAEGVKSGVADIFWPVARHGLRGLYIEMKKENGTPSNFSEEQLDFAAFVIREGYGWYPSFGWEQAAKIIKWYFSEEKLHFPLKGNQGKVLDKVISKGINYGR
jgi:hypothetical protein